MALNDITPESTDHWSDKITVHGFWGDVTVYSPENFKMNADQARLFALAILKAADEADDTCG